MQHYNQSQTKSLFANRPTVSPNNDPLSFIGKKSVDIRTIVPEDEVEMPDMATQEKLAKCGRWFTYFSPKNGKPHSTMHKCRCYTWCARCREDMVRREMKRLNDSAPIYKTEIDNRDWATIAKHLQRNEILYRRYPQVGNVSILFIEQDDTYFPNLERISEVTPEQIDILIQRKPVKSRVSGKLGAPATATNDNDESENGESMQVFIDMICTDADSETQRLARQLAIERTIELDPDGDSIQEALNERTNAYKEALEEMGARIVDVVGIVRYVQISAICWNINSRYSDISTVPNGIDGEPIPF